MLDRTSEGHQRSLFKQNIGEEETAQCANSKAKTVQKWEQTTKSGT